MIQIPVSEPDLAGNEQAYVLDALRSGWISSGSYVKEFERAFAQFVGVQHAVTTVSGTAALHLAVASLGLGPGDEVIVPALTMVASVFAVCYVGAKPVLVDAEPDTFNMDTAQIEAKITPQTRAILPVHLYGHPVDMDPVLDLALRYRLHVIEDAAEAHGAEYRGRRVGSLGDVNAFSFYANKIITTGEGGAVATNDDGLAERVRRLKDLAHSPDRRFVHTEMAYTLRMTNLQAALGLAQIERVDAFLEKKRWMAETYHRYLAGVEGLVLPTEKPWARSVYWMYAVRVTPDFGCGRDELMARLREKGIDSRPFFVPMHRQPVFEKMGLFLGEHYPVAERLSKEGLYLPSGLTLTESQIARVCDAVCAIQQEVRR